MAGVAQSTTIVYTVDAEHVPYRVVAEIDPQQLTLAQFKFSTKRFNYRFFFLSFDQEFGSLKDELFDDTDVCPSSRGVVQAWLLPLDLSDDTTKMSPMTGTSNNLTGMSENNTGISANVSSSRIISGCSSNQSSGQQAGSSVNKIKATQPRGLGGFMTSSPTSWDCLHEQRCRSAEMYREHQHQENTREVLSDTCAEIMARRHWNFGDGCDVRGPVHQGNSSKDPGVEGQDQQCFNSDLSGRGHMQQGRSSANCIPENRSQIQQEVKLGLPGIKEQVQEGESSGYFDKRKCRIGDYSEVPDLVLQSKQKEVCNDTEDPQLQISAKSEVNIHSKMWSDTFNLAFFEEKTKKAIYQTPSEMTKGTADTQANDKDKRKISDQIHAVPEDVFLRPDKFYPTASGLNPNLSNSKTIQQPNIHRIKPQMSTPAGTLDSSSSYPKEKQQKRRQQGQFWKRKPDKGLVQHSSMERQWLKLPGKKESLPSYLEDCTCPSSFRNDVSEQEGQSFSNSGPCSFCENLCPVYQSMNDIGNEPDVKVSTTDIFSVSPLERSLNESKDFHETTEVPADETLADTCITSVEKQQKDNLVTNKPQLSKGHLEANLKFQVEKELKRSKTGPFRSPVLTDTRLVDNVVKSTYWEAGSSHFESGHHEVDVVEICDQGEETHSMTQPLIGRKGHGDKETMKKSDTTDSSGSNSVLQLVACQQLSLVDNEMRETLEAMKYTPLTPEIKDRMWLGCVIPHSVIGRSLIKWLRTYRPGLETYMAAKDFAQKMLDSGILKSFLSTEKKFNEKWYYTVVDGN